MAWHFGHTKSGDNVESIAPVTLTKNYWFELLVAAAGVYLAMNYKGEIKNAGYGLVIVSAVLAYGKYRSSGNTGVTFTQNPVIGFPNTSGDTMGNPPYLTRSGSGSVSEEPTD